MSSSTSPAWRGRVGRQSATAAATGFVLLALGACGSSTSATVSPATEVVSKSVTEGTAPQPAVPSPAQAATATDAAFVASMLPHHMGGIDLGALAASKGQSPAVRRLGAAIKAKQTEEVATLEQLAERLGAQPAAMSSAMEARDMRDMAELESATGKAFDALWLQVISGHHAAAIQMAQIEKGGGRDPSTSELAASIIDTQTMELTRFNSLIEAMKSS